MGRQKIKAKCLSCNKYSTFAYMGTQKNSAGEPIFDLYNCDHCGTTRTFNSRDNTLESKSKETD